MASSMHSQLLNDVQFASLERLAYEQWGLEL